MQLRTHTFKKPTKKVLANASKQPLALIDIEGDLRHERVTCPNLPVSTDTLYKYEKASSNDTHVDHCDAPSVITFEGKNWEEVVALKIEGKYH